MYAHMIIVLQIQNKMRGSQHPHLKLFSDQSSIEKKPKWICIISDNRPHYHNSELMSIVAHWYDWYQIQIRSWLFLELSEAKTTIDSHHASVSFSIIIIIIIIKIFLLTIHFYSKFHMQ